ncbi:hypothetical protein C8R46DRAFT_1092792 [Mycena filopes]|nr:hypothetical protein C8R46DRAFT_1092792 [Mycena filopes]
MSIRHPNIVQICAGASYENMHATLFHGDLVPFKQYIAGYSPIVTVYSYAVLITEWKQVKDYLRSAFHCRDMYAVDCTLWMRPSTHQLSADLVPPDRDDKVNLLCDRSINSQGTICSDPVKKEIIATESLSLLHYHDICSFHFSQFRHKVISTAAAVTLGAVVSWHMLSPADDQYGAQFASLQGCHPAYDGWVFPDNSKPVGEAIDNGWTRYDANEAFNTNITLAVDLWGNCRSSWLSQANNIFSSLHIESDLDNYALVDAGWFKITVSNPTVDCPPGHLFLCPGEDFQVSSTTWRWPNYPAYWSLDALGVERLGTEEATRLGFPPFQLETEVRGVAWDTTVYNGLRQFHQAKGFNPENQDVARHLGYPLYQLSRDVNPPFTRVEEYEQEDRQHTQETSQEDRVGGETVGVGPKRYQIQSPEDTDFEPALHATDGDITATHKILMNIQLVLMLFIATCWMYDSLQ